MLETITLSVIQGITEWLPISSEGAIILAKVNLFGNDLGMGELIRLALFLHLGTFFAALVYFRKEVFSLLKGLLNYKSAEEQTKKLLQFYITATLISGGIGFFLIQIIKNIEEDITFAGKGITLLVGLLLLFTAFLQIKRKEQGCKNIADLERIDGVILGIAQGLSVLPGLSRSGLTVSALLLRKFKEDHALKLSFLMSLPVILGGNIFLNLDKFSFSFESLIALAVTFLLGILTIHILLKIANKLNFGWFVLLFALLTMFVFFIY